MLSENLSEHMKSTDDRDSPADKVEKAMDIREAGLGSEVQSEYMNLKESAKYIGVSFNTLKKLIREEGLSVIMVGGLKRMSKKDIDAFMDVHKV